MGRLNVLSSRPSRNENQLNFMTRSDCNNAASEFAYVKRSLYVVSTGVHRVPADAATSDNSCQNN